MKEILTCEICEGNDFEKFIQVKDFFLSSEYFNLVKCKKCGFVFINPRPENSDLSRYYESVEYISHSGTEKGIVNKIYKKVRNRTHQKKFELISSFASAKNILDIGCGSGELLNLFNKKDWKAMGVEPNPAARDFAKKNYGLEIVGEEDLNKISDHSFHTITMWHVLEHVPDLNSRMNELKRILVREGHIFIAVPHYNSFDGMYYNEFWAAFDVPRHLHHFTPETIEALCKKHKLKIVRTIPMKYDSYYVSLLSEKYKTGKQKLVSGMMTGFKSNRLAHKGNSPYSSQIYVIVNSE